MENWSTWLKSIRMYVLYTLIMACGSTFAQTVVPDSTKSLLNRTPDKEKINIYLTVITRLWRNNPDSALVYAKKAIDLSTRLNDVRAKAIAVRLFGGTYFYLGRYDSALIWCKQSYNYSVSSGDSTLIASSLSNIGEAYIQLGNYPEALENLLQALIIKRKINQKYALAMTLNHIGLVYLKLKDYEKAKGFLMEAMHTANELNDDDGRLYASNNLGFTFLQSGNLEEAKKYFTESINLGKKNNNMTWYAIAFSGMGQVYLNLNQPQVARQYFNNALDLYVKINDKVGISEMYHFISKIHALNNNIDSAFYYVSLSKKSAEATGSRERRLDNFKLLEELYTKRKKFDSALYYKSRFTELRDSTFNENMARTLSNIEVKIAEQESKQMLATKDLLIQKQADRTYFLIAIVIASAIIVIILFRSYKLKSRLSKDLTIKNSEVINQKEEIQVQKEALLASHDKLEAAQKRIEEQNKALASFNKQLRTTVDTRTKELELATEELKVVNLELDNFIYQSSHDLKGPLVRLLGICHVALMDIKDPVSVEYFNMFHEAAQHLNELFDRLKIVNDISSIQTSRSSIDFQKIIEQVKDKLQFMNGFHDIQITEEIEDGIQYNADPFLIETIFQNLTENAIRFRNNSNSKNLLLIKILNQGNNLRILFSDNGIGIKEKNLENLFKMFSKAALEHKTIGMGLYIVKQCVNRLGGSITLLKNNECTEFELLLPLQS